MWYVVYSLLAFSDYVQPVRTYDFATARGNPKHYSCHLDETMIGICKIFCCIGGSMLQTATMQHTGFHLDLATPRKIVEHTHAATFGLRALQHYCCMVSLRWHGPAALEQWKINMCARAVLKLCGFEQTKSPHGVHHLFFHVHIEYISMIGVNDACFDLHNLFVHSDVGYIWIWVWGFSIWNTYSGRKFPKRRGSSACAWFDWTSHATKNAMLWASAAVLQEAAFSWMLATKWNQVFFIMFLHAASSVACMVN